MTPNELQICPRCNWQKRMDYMFPAPRKDPCEELNAWRFQRCKFCGWTGDVATGTQHAFYHIPDHGWMIDGKYYKELRGFFTRLELC